MEFVAAFFKFSPSERFGENVCWLFLRGDELHSNCVVFYLLPCEMIINFEMFGSFMDDRVVAKFYATLIITEKRGRFVIQDV